MAGTVPVEGYRSRIDWVGDGVEVNISIRRNYFVTLFLLCWLGGWYFGETHAIQQILHPKNAGDFDGFTFFWLCGWTLGGIAVATTVVWNLMGRQRVLVQSDTLSVRNEILGIGLTRRYDLSAVRDLRALEKPQATVGRRGSYVGGMIAFDYGAKTIEFGPGLDAAEAKYIVSKLIAAKPSFAPKISV